MSDKKDLILKRVRAMLAKADSTEFEGEAEVFRAKADELMTKYTIEQWQLDAADDADKAGREPERRDVDIRWYWDPAYGHLKHNLFTLFSHVAEHCRCKVVWWNAIEREAVPVLGLPADLDYFDLLFTHLQIQLSAKLTPGVEKGDSYIEALVRMKEAGMRWKTQSRGLLGMRQGKVGTAASREDAIERGVSVLSRRGFSRDQIRVIG